MKKPTAGRGRGEAIVSETWKSFYGTEGRAAIAALLTEFDIYTPAPKGLDLFEAGRREGHRDVLLRIAHLINLKSSDFVADMREDADILDRIMTR